MKINSIVNQLKNNIPYKRFLHSINTAKKAEELALIYDCDQEKAYIAGLLHDCAKDLPISSLVELLKDEKYSSAFMNCSNILHAPAGAILAKNEYNIEDKNILSAIKYHCYGNINMSLLEKVVYIADKIEDSRNYDGILQLRKMAESELDKAILTSLTFIVNNSMEKGYYLYDGTIKAKVYYELLIEKKANL